MSIRSLVFKVFSESEVDETKDSHFLRWLSVLDDVVIGCFVLANVFAVIFFPEAISLALFFTAFFLCEYCIKIWAAGSQYRGRNLLHYALSGGRLLDFIVTVPPILLFAYVEMGGNEGSLKLTLVVRLLYIFRVLKLGKTFSFAEKLLEQVRKLLPFLMSAYLMIFVVAVIAAALAYFFENDAQPEVFDTLGDSLWWAVTTLSTVGYGDMFPVTAPGRAIGTLTMAIGIAFYGIPLALMGGAVQAALIEQQDESQDRLNQIEHKLDLIVNSLNLQNPQNHE